MITRPGPSAPRRRSGLTAVVALAAVLALTLSGCVTWFLPTKTSSTSTPSPEKVAAALQPYYRQVLKWTGCGNGMQCTTAKAPLDWNDPGRGEIELALIRQPAKGTKQGSLLTNPGGPGASGYDFVKDSVDFVADKTLQDHFDIVGFDPRGVGRSTAVKCYDAKQMDDYLYGITPGVRGSDQSRKTSATPARRTPARRFRASTPSPPPVTSTCCGRPSATRS